MTVQPNTFNDEDVSDAVKRWSPDNVQDGTEFELVKQDGKVYNGFIVKEVKDKVETGNMIKVYWFFAKIGKDVKTVKFGQESMDKWIQKYGSKPLKWIGKSGIFTHRKIGNIKYLVAVPKGTSQDNP